MTLPVGKVPRLEPVAHPRCRFCLGRHVAREVARQKGAMGLVRLYSRQMGECLHPASERVSAAPTAAQGW